MRRLLTPAAGLLVLLLAAFQALAAEPAFPALTGRVVDEAGILDAAAEAGLSRDLEAHERATGEQVVVATVRSLQGDTVEDYANRLHRHWGIGQKGKDNGVLLLVAPTERKVRIEAGYGLEGELTDAAASTIVQSVILPRFRNGDLSGGVVAGTHAVLDLLKPEDGTRPAWTPPVQHQQQGQGWAPILMFVAFLVIAILMNRGRQRVYRSGRYGFPPVIIGPGGFGGGGFGSGGFGGGGGGGFSGGGGSSGGGGASGSW